MPQLGEKAVLDRLRLCRADVLAEISNGEGPPSLKTLRELADLQLTIMATEAVILDKSDSSFMAEYERDAAA
jgi:hypothetical protein